MKTPSIRRRNGFTLVELLVVVAIILILASASFAVAMRAMKKAKETKSLATATALETAVTQFYTEYGRLPDISGSTADAEYDTDMADGQTLLMVLLGKDTTQNPKQLSFLSVQQGKEKGSGGIDGLVYNPGSSTSVRGLYDPWGHPYKITLDGDYDEELSVKNGAITKMLKGRRVAVYGVGADGKNSTDDVKNW